MARGFLFLWWKLHQKCNQNSIFPASQWKYAIINIRQFPTALLLFFLNVISKTHQRNWDFFAFFLEKSNEIRSQIIVSYYAQHRRKKAMIKVIFPNFFFVWKIRSNILPNILSVFIGIFCSGIFIFSFWQVWLHRSIKCESTNVRWVATKAHLMLMNFYYIMSLNEKWNQPRQKQLQNSMKTQ